MSSSFHSRSPTQSRRISSRASLRQVTLAESPAGRDHHRPVTSSEPRGDRYIYRGRGRPPCQHRDTSTVLLYGRVQSSLDNGRGISSASTTPWRRNTRQAAAVESLVSDGPILVDGYINTVHVISLPDRLLVKAVTGFNFAEFRCIHSLYVACNVLPVYSVSMVYNSNCILV